MPKQDNFHYTVQARCSRADAVRLFADLSAQADLHPLIIRVEPRPARPGALRSYTISDRLAWGPFTFRTSYQADILTANEDEVVAVARQWPNTTVRNHARLSSEPDGITRIDVQITLSAPGPLFAYAFRQARTAHLALGSRIQATLDATPTA
ncbi:SRPBCC family protein [Micromonospora sp. NBC_01796]|uniref:SRPBCC family protein n=1 Tax=Micromonospora sp. NBC_01796 TaxID=2975987 RepID=UPI002DD92A76|nr:SRPBCC family protein [Micromonospora sp. NBC_01796]WSA83142.1 SRPBCC family protein [Micromonospora sp. NBC_01796]